MGSLFGADEQKAKSTSKSTTSADPLYTQGYANLAGQAQTAAAKPYDPAANKNIAGFTAPQQQAFGQVQSNLGNYQPYLDVGGAAIDGNTIQQYMNPYQQNVIDATQNQFNTQNARSAQSLNSGIAQKGAYGGSGQMVAQALQSEANQNAQNPVIAGLYQLGHNTAVQNAQADANRALTAGGLAQQWGQNDVNSLLGIGNQQQGQQQNTNDAASANASAAAGYDMDKLSWLAKIMQGGAGLSQTTTGNSTQTQSAGGSGLGQMIGTGLSLFSMLKDGGRVNGYAEGGSVGYQPGSYVPDVDLKGGIQSGGQAPSIGSQTQGGGVSQGMGDVLNSFKAAQGAVGGMQRAFGKANTTTDANGWATTSQPQSAAGWGNWLGNGGLGSMFAFAEGGRVEDEAGLGNVFANLEAVDSPVMNAGVRPLVAPTETGSIQAVPQGPAAPAQKSGFLGLNFSDPMRQGLLSAGLGMMASRSGVPAMALGQGGLQGIQAYQNATEQEAQQAQRKSMLEQQAAELRQRQLDAQQRFAQTSERMNMDREQHDWTRKYQQAQIERMQQAGARGRTPSQMTMQEREAAALEQGMKKGTPEFQTYVLGGRMSNPPRQMPSILDRETVKADISQVKDMKEAASGASQMLTALDNLEAARAETESEGPWQGWAAEKLGTDAAQRVGSASEEVRLGFVGKTKGAVSDSEMRIFGKATPGMLMTDAAAEPILKGMRLAAQRTQEQAKFFDIWMRANGNLAGAPEAWSKFINENPVIMQDSKTQAYTFKPENVAAWKPYLKQAKEPGAGLLPDHAEAQPQDAGGDYQEGAILENADGERIMLQGNEWVPAP